MRITIKLDPDVAAAIEQLRRDEALGVSEALNRIARAGLVRGARRRPFRQRSVDMGDFLVDISNVAEALDILEGPMRRCSRRHKHPDVRGESHAPEHDRAAEWLETQLNGTSRVRLAWESLTGFYRIATNPRAMRRPMRGPEAWQIVHDWLRAPFSWIPAPTDRRAEVLGGLVERHRVTGTLVSDAHLAAIALQHGLEICSADTDFARFTEVSWRNPLA